MAGVLFAPTLAAAQEEVASESTPELTTVIVTVDDSVSGAGDLIATRTDLVRTTEVMPSGPTTAGQVHRVYENLGAFVATVDESQLDALRADPNVRSIEMEELAAPALETSVPHIGADRLHVEGITGGPAPEGSTPVVAVMDTGVDGSHASFGSRVLAGACFARGSDGLVGSGDCPNDESSQFGGGAGAACDFGPACDHGTHVAGIVASGDAANRGVAPDSAILPIQVFSDFGGSPLSWKSDQLAGLDWLIGQVEAGANVVALNMSLGGGRYTSAAQCDAANPSRDVAFRRLGELGVAVVASSGNNGWSDAMSAPACVSSAISVGATAIDDSVACYSNSNADLDFWAPGGASCFGFGGGIVAPVPGGGFQPMSGTSMAAPHLAGSVALLGACLVAPDSSLLIDTLRASGPVIERGGASAPRIDVLGAAHRLVVEDAIEQAALVSLGRGQTRQLSGSNRCAGLEAERELGTLWYRLDPSSSGMLVASTASGPSARTTFETTLTLFKGPADASQPGDLVELVSDTDSGPAGTSRIAAPVNGGDHYYLRLASADERGLFSLTVVLGPTYCAGRLVTHVADTPALLRLGPADQVVLGTEASNLVSLGGGDDVLCAGGGDDRVFAGSGADIVYGGQGDDVVWGGSGDDQLFGNDGADELIGDGGDDRLNGNGGADTIRAGSGNDVVVGGAGDDLIFGNDGDDALLGNDGNDRIEGQGGGDRIVGHNGIDSLHGGTGDDHLLGGPGVDELFGHDGADRLHGGDGGDLLWGGDGPDTVDGAAGDDRVRGNGGDDVVRGGVGADLLWGGTGTDTCDGGVDADADQSAGCESSARVP